MIRTKWTRYKTQSLLVGVVCMKERKRMKIRLHTHRTSVLSLNIFSVPSESYSKLKSLSNVLPYICVAHSKLFTNIFEFPWLRAGVKYHQNARQNEFPRVTRNMARKCNYPSFEEPLDVSAKWKERWNGMEERCLRDGDGEIVETLEYVEHRQRVRGKYDVRASRHWIRPWWKKCLLISIRRKRKSLSEDRRLPLHNVTPKSSRAGFAFSEHRTGRIRGTRRERERERRERE